MSEPEGAGTDHRLLQETIGLYALHALDHTEASEAETLLALHLPTCPECRSTLEGFRAVAGELALAAPSRRPPRTQGARLGREIRARGRRWLLPTVAAAVVLAVVGLAVWNAHLARRVRDAETRQARTTELIVTMSRPESRVVPLSTDPGSATPVATRSSAQLSAAFAPGRGAVYLFGSLPAPRRHRVYQVWVIKGSQFASAGTFVPEEHGSVLIKIETEPSRIDGLLVTEEPDTGSAEPSGERVGTASF